MNWHKVNADPIPIETVPDEHEEFRDFEPSFWWNNRRYFIADFIRVHDNPWLGYTEMPEYIHGMEMDNYWNPLFIELTEGNEAVNIWEESRD